MAIIINIDVMMAKRKMSLGELAERVDITLRFPPAPSFPGRRYLHSIFPASYLRQSAFQPGDIIEYRPEETTE